MSTSLSHIVFTTLPFDAQHLQLASNYLDWRQVERLQLIYNYSCQAGDCYRSTLEYYYNMTTAKEETKTEVVDVEETTTGAATSLPALRAPRPDHLVDWHDVKDLIDSFIKAHKNYNLKLPSKTMKAYYATFSELLLPAATDGDGGDSEPEEELQSMTQTHRMWAPLHALTTESGDGAETYYIVLDGEGLHGWQDSGRNDIEISEWKATQHLHLFQLPQHALNYAVSLVSAAMSTTNVPLNEGLRLVAVNLYPEVVLQRNLLHTYKRSWSNYLELENHSDSLRNMNGFATPTVIISGCNYNYIVQMLTPHYFEHHGDLHVELQSLQYLVSKGTTNCVVVDEWRRVSQNRTSLLDALFCLDLEPCGQ